MGLQLGYSSFSSDKINDWFVKYVCHLHPLWSECEDKHAWRAKQHARLAHPCVWRSWAQYVCVYFHVCGHQRTQIPQLEHHGWRHHHMGSAVTKRLVVVACHQGRTSSDFNENQPKHQNRNFLKTFATICDEICILPSFNLILDIPITKLTELWL